MPKNRGTLYARSLGISLANDYLIFLDADDELYPAAISYSMKLQISSGADIVYFNSVKYKPESSDYVSWDSPDKIYNNISSGILLSERMS